MASVARVLSTDRVRSTDCESVTVLVTVSDDSDR